MACSPHRYRAGRCYGNTNNILCTICHVAAAAPPQIYVYATVEVFAALYAQLARCQIPFYELSREPGWAVGWECPSNGYKLLLHVSKYPVIY